MRSGGATEGLASRLAKYDDLIDREPVRAALEMARALAEELATHRGKISGYQFRNLRMRTEGVLGTALLATGRSREAADVLLEAKAVRAVAPVERTPEGIRGTRCRYLGCLLLRHRPSR